MPSENSGGGGVEGQYSHTSKREGEGMVVTQIIREEAGKFFGRFEKKPRYSGVFGEAEG